MKLSLIVLVAGPTNGKAIPITRSPFLIGRDPKCHLRPSSALVSNCHCSLQIRGGRVFITDLGSRNGTFINDERVTQEQELKNDDRLLIGPLAFGVRLESSVSVDQPTPLPPSKPAVSEDDTIAEVLLSTQDDGTPVIHSGPVDSSGVPVGGTEVLNTQTVPVPTQTQADTGSATKAETKKDAKGSGNTQSAAEEILKRYLRRPRKV
jgi:pSer/pThr/pTyr-binding forkhead associated (FHA) protein